MEQSQLNGLVRLKSDPGRHGVLTGRVRERRGVVLRQVRFMDGTSSYVPDDQIEAMDSGPQDPLELLEAGRLGGSADLRRAITHVRLTGRLANIIYSMDTTGTDFYAYQFKPVLKLLNSVSTGILIADEVGLGKTIEAGLIWTELCSRFDFRRLCVLCPAVLREKWQRELRTRFGVDADILGAAEAHARLRRAVEEGSSARFAIISSMQGIRPRRGWEDEDAERINQGASALAHFLRERQQEDPLIDLVVIDEAHYLRNPETMTAAVGRLLRGISHYVLLLSATPIHLRSEDLFQLANLVDADTFSHPQAFDDILEANEPLVRLRESVVSGTATPASIVSQIEIAQQHPLLKGNRQLEILRSDLPTGDQLRDARFVSHLAYRLETANLLGHVVTRTRKRDVTEWRVVRDVHAEEIPLSELERDFYEAVTSVVREYCERAAAHEGFLLVMPQRQMSSSMPAALRYWRERQDARLEDLYEDIGLDELPEDARSEGPGPLVQEIISRVDELGDLDLLWKNDSKYNRFRDCVKAFFQSHRGEKLVVFSYFRPTLSYLRERLRQDGIASVMLVGGMDDKDAAIAEFQERPGPLVLLSSEVGSEGIDLQFAWALINYDLPWNPMRVEQRIGRVDRLGQQSPKVVIWNLFCEGTIDARIYRRLFERLEIFRRTLGALEPVLGERIRDLTMDLLRNHLTPLQEEERIEQARRALENIRRHEEDLESQAAHLVAYGDYILNHVQAARELNRRIDGRDIFGYVTDFFGLNYPGCEFRQLSEDVPEFEVSLSTDAKHDFESFLRGQRMDGTTQLTRNDLRSIRCRFENTTVGTRNARLEIVSQFHPLVRFVGHRINQAEHYFHPATAVRLASHHISVGIPEGVYVFSAQRWSVRGLQEIEQLHFSAVPWSAPDTHLDGDLAERLVTTAAIHGEDWPAVSEHVDLASATRIANDQCLGESDAQYEEFVRDICAQNQDRADLQERTLDQHYTNQMRTLQEVRERHQQRGRSALIKATEGRIDALRNRVERRRKEIHERREVKHSRDEVCIGVIDVVAPVGGGCS